VSILRISDSDRSEKRGERFDNCRTQLITVTPVPANSVSSMTTSHGGAEKPSDRVSCMASVCIRPDGDHRTPNSQTRWSPVAIFIPEQHQHDVRLTHLEVERRPIRRTLIRRHVGSRREQQRLELRIFDPIPLRVNRGHAEADQATRTQVF
jgi:hypothetical protein